MQNLKSISLTPQKTIYKQIKTLMTFTVKISFQKSINTKKNEKKSRNNLSESDLNETSF